jgi:hypothetical protein
MDGKPRAGKRSPTILEESIRWKALAVGKKR